MFIGSTYISEAVQTHARLFAAAVLWGAAVALVYDGIRISRRVFATPLWLCACEDILFWVAEALLIYRLLFIYDSGAIRSYTMLGMITGMLLYVRIFGRWLAGCISCGIRRILNFFRKCLCGILKFLRILFRPIYLLLKKL